MELGNLSLSGVKDGKVQHFIAVCNSEGRVGFRRVMIEGSHYVWESPLTEGQNILIFKLPPSPKYENNVPYAMLGADQVLTIDEKGLKLQSFDSKPQTFVYVNVPPGKQLRSNDVGASDFLFHGSGPLVNSLETNLNSPRLSFVPSTMVWNEQKPLLGANPFYYDQPQQPRTTMFNWPMIILLILFLLVLVLLVAVIFKRWDRTYVRKEVQVEILN